MGSSTNKIVAKILETMVVDGVEWKLKQIFYQEEPYSEPVEFDGLNEWSAILPSGANAYALLDGERGFEVGLSDEIEEALDPTTVLSTFEFGIRRYEVPKHLFTRTALELEKIHARALAGLRAAL